MRKVQRLAAGLLALSLSIACAQAEILTIDIDQASYEEINTVYQQLKQARIDKLRYMRQVIRLNPNQILCSEGFRGERQEVKWNSRLGCHHRYLNILQRKIW